MDAVGIGHLVTPPDDAEGTTPRPSARRGPAGGGRPCGKRQWWWAWGPPRSVEVGPPQRAGTTLPTTATPSLPGHWALSYHRPRWTLSSIVRRRRAAEADGGSGVAGSPKQDSSEPSEAAGHPEGGAQRLLAPEVAQERRAEAGVGGTEQHGHGGEGGIDPPERDHPLDRLPRRVVPCPAPGSGRRRPAGSAKASTITGARDSPANRREPCAPRRVGGGLPVPGGLRRHLQDHELPALGVPGRRCPQRPRQQPVDDARQRAGGR